MDTFKPVVMLAVVSILAACGGGGGEPNTNAGTNNMVSTFGTSTWDNSTSIYSPEKSSGVWDTTKFE